MNGTDVIRLWCDGSAEASAVESNLKLKGYEVHTVISTVREPRVSYNGVLISGYAAICGVFDAYPARTPARKGNGLRY